MKRMILKVKRTVLHGDWDYFEIESCETSFGVMYPEGVYVDYRVGNKSRILSILFVNRKGEGQKIITDNEAYLISDIGKTIEKLN